MEHIVESQPDLSRGITRESNALNTKYIKDWCIENISEDDLDFVAILSQN